MRKGDRIRVSLARSAFRMIRKGIRKKLVPKHEVRRIEVPVRSCVHFSAIRYGNRSHPFEIYLAGLRAETPIREVRKRLIEFLQHYRPDDMGQALGIRSLSREYPIWSYPWTKLTPGMPPLNPGWHASPTGCPDIMAHFSDVGIPSQRIEEQFLWLERAFTSIKSDGYQPERYGDFVTARPLVRSDGETVYLLLDGNHRVSALAVLGEERVLIEYDPRDAVRAADWQTWPGVRSSFYTPDDALRVFEAYFQGNTSPRTTETPAPLLAPLSWTTLYGLADA